MASDLSVPRVGPPSAAAEPGRVRSSGQGPSAAAFADKPSEGVGDAGKPMPNPTLRLDPGLALVVIEFRDGAGKVRETIPTEAQLDAYRASQRSSNGPVPPPGMAGREGAAEPGARDRLKPVGAGGPDARGLPDLAQQRERAQPVAQPDGTVAAEPRAVAVAQPRGAGDSAVPGLPVKASETGTV